MDKITVTGIKFYAYHGALDHEKEQGQDFIVDCCYTLDTSLCHDSLEQTVSYGGLSCDIAAFGKNHRFDLIETLANNLAKYLLLKYQRIQEVQITVHKPFAPIKTPFHDVSITITRGWNTCYLSIGSNLGDRKKYLDSVSECISNEDEIQEITKSSYLETKPYGVLDQPKFLNAVIKIRTIFTPTQLLQFMQKVEQLAGRERKRHWGERTLDVDILTYGDTVLFTPELIIPHPEMCMRKFVLEPLCEIEPYFVHPIQKKNIKELLQTLDNQ